MTYPAMAARRPIRSQQTLLDPIDHGPGIDVEKTADFVCRIDGFGTALRLIHDAEQNPIISISDATLILVSYFL